MDTTEQLIDQLIERTIVSYKTNHLEQALSPKDKRLLFIIIKLELGDHGSPAIAELLDTPETDQANKLEHWAKQIADMIAGTFRKYQELAQTLGDGLQTLAQASVDVSHPDLQNGQRAAQLRLQQRRLGHIIASL